MQGIDEWLTREDESTVSGVGEGARGGGNGGTEGNFGGGFGALCFRYPLRTQSAGDPPPQHCSAVGEAPLPDGESPRASERTRVAACSATARIRAPARAWTRPPASPRARISRSASRAPLVPCRPAWPPPGFAHRSRSPGTSPRRRAPLPYCRPAPCPACRSRASPSRASWRAPLGPMPCSASRAHAMCCQGPPEVLRAREDADAAASGAAGQRARELTRHARWPGGSRAAGLQRPGGAGAEEMKGWGRIEEGSAWEG